MPFPYGNDGALSRIGSFLTRAARATGRWIQQAPSYTPSIASANDEIVKRASRSASDALSWPPERSDEGRVWDMFAAPGRAMGRLLTRPPADESLGSRAVSALTAPLAPAENLSQAIGTGLQLGYERLKGIEPGTPESEVKADLTGQTLGQGPGMLDQATKVAVAGLQRAAQIPTRGMVGAMTGAGGEAPEIREPWRAANPWSATAEEVGKEGAKTAIMLAATGTPAAAVLTPELALLSEGHRLYRAARVGASSARALEGTGAAADAALRASREAKLIKAGVGAVDVGFAGSMLGGIAQAAERYRAEQEAAGKPWFEPTPAAARELAPALPSAGFLLAMGRNAARGEAPVTKPERIQATVNKLVEHNATPEQSVKAIRAAEAQPSYQEAGRFFEDGTGKVFRRGENALEEIDPRSGRSTRQIPYTHEEAQRIIEEGRSARIGANEGMIRLAFPEADVQQDPSDPNVFRVQMGEGAPIFVRNEPEGISIDLEAFRREHGGRDPFPDEAASGAAFQDQVQLAQNLADMGTLLHETRGHISFSRLTEKERAVLMAKAVPAAEIVSRERGEVVSPEELIAEIQEGFKAAQPGEGAIAAAVRTVTEPIRRKFRQARPTAESVLEQMARGEMLARPGAEPAPAYQTKPAPSILKLDTDELPEPLRIGAEDLAYKAALEEKPIGALDADLEPFRAQIENLRHRLARSFTQGKADIDLAREVYQNDPETAAMIAEKGNGLLHIERQPGFDVVLQLHNGRIVGTVEAVEGKLVGIAGGKGAGSPVSAAPLYKWARENYLPDDIVTAAGELARRRILRRQASEALPREAEGLAAEAGAGPEGRVRPAPGRAPTEVPPEARSSEFADEAAARLEAVTPQEPSRKELQEQRIRAYQDIPVLRETAHKYQTQREPRIPNPEDRKDVDRLVAQMRRNGYDVDAKLVASRLRERGWTQIPDSYREAWRQIEGRSAAASKAGSARAAARQSFEEATPHVNHEVVRAFRNTSFPESAGYIRPTGALVDLSGGGYRERGEDHRIVGGRAGMQEIGSQGWIRWMPESNGLDMYKAPTEAQYRQIRSLAARANGKVIIDLQEGLGEWDPRNEWYGEPKRKTYLEYPAGTKPAKIVGDIRRFYAGEDLQGVRFQTKRERDDRWYFSSVRRAVDSPKFPKAINGDSALAMIRKQPGVKDEELVWTGLDEFLKGKKKVTKEEVQQFLDANETVVEETVLGSSVTDDSAALRPLADWLTDNAKEKHDWNYWSSVAQRAARGIDTAREAIAEQGPPKELLSLVQGGPTKHGQWQLPGGEKYRELLLRFKRPRAEVPLEITELPGNYEVTYDRRNDRYGVVPTDQAHSRTVAGWWPTKDEAISTAIKQINSDRQVDAADERLRGDFTGGHYGEYPNVLAHIRFNERSDADGKRVLFLEEIQSDLHQAGREYGYRRGESEEERRLIARNAEIEKALAPLNAKISQAREEANSATIGQPATARPGPYGWEVYTDKDLPFGVYNGASAEEVVRHARRVGPTQFSEEARGQAYREMLQRPEYAEAVRARDALIIEQRRNENEANALAMERRDAVPDVPFKESWHQLAFRRAVRWAAEHGFDRVAWTTGAQQIDRYNEALRQNVDKIEWERSGPGKKASLETLKQKQQELDRLPPFGMSEPEERSAHRRLSIEIERIKNDLKKAGGAVYVSARKSGQSVFDELIPLSGKTFIQGKEVSLEDVVGKQIAERIRNEPNGVAEGEGLAIGGKGMQAFYDVDLPNYAKKLGKKFGAQVGEAEIPTSKEFFKRGGEWNESQMLRAHAMDITPEMRRSVMEDKLPLYQTKREGKMEEPALREFPEEPGRPMEPDEAPRVAEKVAELREAEGAAGKEPRPLARDDRQAWTDLDPLIRSYVEHRSDEEWHSVLKKRNLDAAEVQAWEMVVRGKEEDYRNSLAKLEEERQKTSYAATGKPVDEVTRARLDKMTAETLAKQLAWIADRHAEVEDGTGTARALAARARVMKAARSKESFDNQLLRKIWKEIPGVTDKDAATIVTAWRRDPTAVPDLIRAATSGSRSWWRKTMELWKAGLLSAPSTQMANVTGNFGEHVMRILETGVAPVVERALLAGKGGPRTRYFGEVRAEIAGGFSPTMTGKALAQLLRDYRDIYTLKDKPIDLAQKFEFQIGAWGGTGGKVIRTVFRRMEAADRMAKTMGRNAELYKRAYRKALAEGGSRERIASRMAELIKNNFDPENSRADPDLLQALSQEELNRTFQEDPFASVKALNRVKWIDPFVPFKRTPANILRRTIERSPAGLVKAAQAIAKYQRGEISSGEAADIASRAVVGTALFGFFAALAAKGFMTGGGPADYKEKSTLRETGWQPYSFVFPKHITGLDRDYYIPFSRFEPVGTLLGLSADAFETADQKTAENAAERAYGMIVENLINKSYLKGLADVAEVYNDPRRYMGRWLSSMAGTVVPNIVARSATALDPTLRETRGDDPGLAGFGQRVSRTIQSRLPVLSESLPARRSATGEEVKRPGGTGVAGGLMRFVSPTQASGERSGKELEKLLVQIGYIPTQPVYEMSVRGTKIRLTEAQREILKKANADAAAHIRRYLLPSPKFQALPDNIGDGPQGGETKEGLIRDAYSKAKALRARQVRSSPDFLVAVRKALKDLRETG